MELKKQSDQINWLLLVGILLLTFIVYLPSLKGDLSTWDDEVHILKNPHIQTLSLESIKNIFNSTINRTYIPLTQLIWALEHQLFGFNPFVYHLNNLLLHLFNVILVFVFMHKLRLSSLIAFIATVIFAVHPVHVESVAWATERKDVLYAFFYLLSLISYLYYLNRQKGFYFIGSVLFAVLSLLSKPMAISLPLILMLLDWYQQRKDYQQAVVEKVPFILVVIMIGWISYQLNSRPIHFDFITSTLTWVWCFMFYIYKFFIPMNFSPLYIAPQPVGFENIFYLGGFLSFVLFLIVCLKLRRNRQVIFSLLFYVFSIFFLLRMDHIADVNDVADRFMYLPCLGFCILVGVFLEYLLLRRRAGLFVKLSTPILIAVLSLQTFQYSKVWNNDLNLWTKVLKKYPENFRAHFSMAQVCYVQGKKDLAKFHNLMALKNNPRHAKTHNNLGEIVYVEGNHDLALQHFQQAIYLNPDYDKALNNLAIMFMERGLFEQAHHTIDRAIKLKPDQSHYWVSKGDIYLNQKAYFDAEQSYLRAARIKRSASLMNRLGIIALNLNEKEKARRYFLSGLKLQPNHPEILANLNLLNSK